MKAVEPHDTKSEGRGYQGLVCVLLSLELVNRTGVVYRIVLSQRQQGSHSLGWAA